MNNQLIAWAGSLILTAGSVWAMVTKFSPKIRKALKISKEVMDLLDALLSALDDRKVTKEEVEAIMSEVIELQEALK